MLDCRRVEHENDAMMPSACDISTLRMIDMLPTNQVRGRSIFNHLGRSRNNAQLNHVFNCANSNDASLEYQMYEYTYIYIYVYNIYICIYI